VIEEMEILGKETVSIPSKRSKKSKWGVPEVNTRKGKRVGTKNHSRNQKFAR